MQKETTNPQRQLLSYPKTGFMTIGIIVDNEFYGDPRVNNEAKILHKSGFNVVVLCFNFEKFPATEKIEGIEIVRIPISKKKKNLLFGTMNTCPVYHWLWAKHIEKFIEKYSIDILHVNDLYMAKSAKMGTKTNKIPIVLDLHENYPAAILSYNWAIRFPARLIVRPQKWKRLEKKYLSYADRLIVLSDTYKDDLLNKYSFLKPENITVYSNVPDLDELLSYPVDLTIFDKGDNFLLFYFGGISERRGIFTTLEALKILLKKGLAIKLLVIGPVDKADKPLFDACLQNNIFKDKVIHYPWKDISLFPSYVSISDVCLSPIVKNDQHESGVANKIFQYMLFERPIIVSDCKPQVKIVEEGKCGLVFQSENAEDLAEKIKYLVTNKNSREEMGKKGKSEVMNKYNTKIFAQALIKMYKKIL